MALLKLYRHARQYGVLSSVKKLLAVLPGYVTNVHRWRVRRCQCCGRVSVFVAGGTADEFTACLFCSANQRYELLATEIRSRFGDTLAEKDVLELDPHSPLGGILSRARSHIRTFYDSEATNGSARGDGTVCEDITSLTLQNESLDLIVSSDVLEHVPSLEEAFKETARVLRPGGVHLFTVPPRSVTRKRAVVVDGQVQNIQPPEYHCDPLCPRGILTFWDIGPDLPKVVSPDGLEIRIVVGPVGEEGRLVWMAKRPERPEAAVQ